MARLPIENPKWVNARDRSDDIDLIFNVLVGSEGGDRTAVVIGHFSCKEVPWVGSDVEGVSVVIIHVGSVSADRSEEHTSELQSQSNIVCRLLLEKKKNSRNPEASQATHQHVKHRV